MVASTCVEITNFEARIDLVGGDCTATKCMGVRDSACGNGYRNIWQSTLDDVYFLFIYKTINVPGTLFGLAVGSFEPVGNDVCSDAIPLPVGSSIVKGSTLNATHDEVEYLIPSGQQGDCNLQQNSQPGVWYTITGTGETLLASTCNELTTFASKVSVFRGGCEAIGCVATQDQFCNEKESVYWDSEDGVEYLIFVHGGDYGVAANVGDFGLTVDKLVTAEHDFCENAIAFDDIGTTKLGSTFAATPDEVSSCDGLEDDAPGVWYTLEGSGKVLRAATCDPATTFDTKISIYQGSCGSLSCVIADDNSCGIQSSARWMARVGIRYYILVHGRRSSSVGDFALVVAEYTPTFENDFCDGAMMIEADGSPTVGSTSTANFDNAGQCGTVRNSAAGVWYELIGTGTLFTASLCHSETNYDTALSVYTGECVALECIAGNADGGGSTCARKSVVSWVTRVGKTYFLLVHGFDVRVGDFVLTVEEPESAVENDFCVHATPLSLGKDAIRGTTVGTVNDKSPICLDVDQDGSGVWYTVQGDGRPFVVSTCNGNNGKVTDFDTRISVFTGECGNLTCTRADDNACGFQSRVVWETKPGVVYYILVHGSSQGSFGLTVDRFVSQQQNDLCDKAVGPIFADDKVIFGSTIGSSFDDKGYCGVSNTGSGVWYFVFVSNWS
jgi:hypothetical protein